MKEQLDKILADLQGALRYKWHALIVAWVVCLIGWFVIFTLPDRYETRAQIYVDTSSILKPLLQNIAVSPNTENAADLVRRALLARPTLEKVADTTGLIQRAGNNADEQEHLLLKLEQDLTINGDNKSNVYTIVYADRNPKMAQSVVASLLDTFVHDSLGVSRTDTRNAQEFLKQQVAEYEQRLSESESKLADFKKEHIGLMPDQRGDYFNRLQAELTSNNTLQTSLAVASRQRDELRRKITGISSDGAVPNMPSDSQIQAATQLDTQIQDSKRQLEALLLRFTDKHPDVIALRDTITRLEARRRTELGGVRATTVAGGSGANSGVDAVMQSLQIQLNNADVQVAALQAEVGQSNARVGELRRALTTGPEVEAQLASLNRDYAVIKGTYDALLQRFESARISDRADQSEDVRFRMIEPPRVPVQPSAPMRGVLMVAILFFGAIVGVAVALGLNLANPVFVAPRSITDVLKLPVLGVVSTFAGAAEALVQRRRRLALAGTFGLLLVTFVGLAAVSHAGSRLLRSSLGME
ncbi:MAG TPA: XrtA system polysaccharide chain length determinant [Steroidobacteraceae bacterium]|nr:XrtA system polysaccharide chain length determinant [Steroidobacteraceae bacterium]